MLRNEPFEWLPLSYRPVQKFDHNPSRLSFGIAIPEEFTQFCQVALENNLGDPEMVKTADTFFELRTLVIPLTNIAVFYPRRASFVATSILWKRRSCLDANEL